MVSNCSEIHLVRQRLSIDIGHGLLPTPIKLPDTCGNKLTISATSSLDARRLRLGRPRGGYLTEENQDEKEAGFYFRRTSIVLCIGIPGIVSFAMRGVASGID
jgi:hypothetical protein